MEWWIYLISGIIIWRIIMVIRYSKEDESFTKKFKRFACGKSYTRC